MHKVESTTICGRPAGLETTDSLRSVGQIQSPDIVRGFFVSLIRTGYSLWVQKRQFQSRRNGANLPITALVDQFYSEVEKVGGKRWDASSLPER